MGKLIMVHNLSSTGITLAQVTDEKQRSIGVMMHTGMINPGETMQCTFNQLFQPTIQITTDNNFAIVRSPKADFSTIIIRDNPLDRRTFMVRFE